jgi:site-specific recombinase XerC
LGSVVPPIIATAGERAADIATRTRAGPMPPSIAAVQPVHVATWIEAGTRDLAVSTIKQRLAAIRHLFDWLVISQVVPVDPAASVHGPWQVVASEQTPVLDPAQQHRRLDACSSKRSRADQAGGAFIPAH